MKYNEAMASPDREKWLEAVKEEYHKMIRYNVFKFVPEDAVPDNATILTSTWAMKKKSSGAHRARINARGYEQLDGEHYDKDNVASPTVNLVSIRILFVLLILMRGIAHLIDVNGAFLLGQWEKDQLTQQHRKYLCAFRRASKNFCLRGGGLYSY